VIRLFVMFAIVAQGAMAEGTDEVFSIGQIKQDEYGCAVIERPSSLTFTTFRDAWRTVAADKLYSLRRHQNAVENQKCDCAVLRPDWSIIAEGFTALGFADGPSTTYDEWADTAYYPVISDLRRTVRDLCEGAN